jgi:putative transposase
MKHGRGYVYDLYFHIVWCVKYRHKVLVGSVKDDLIDIIKNICMNNNYELVEINTDLDHIHLLIGLSPQDSIPVVMKTLKGVSARLLNSKHKDELSKVLYGGHIWSPSYYIATTSDNVMENIKQYIIHQGDVDKRKG